MGKIDSEERERVRVTGRQTGGEGRRGRERETPTHRAMSQLCEGSGGKKVRRKEKRKGRKEWKEIREYSFHLGRFEIYF